jgi:hypothetical protein
MIAAVGAVGDEHRKLVGNGEQQELGKLGLVAGPCGVDALIAGRECLVLQALPHQRSRILDRGDERCS